MRRADQWGVDKPDPFERGQGTRGACEALDTFAGAGRDPVVNFFGDLRTLVPRSLTGSTPPYPRRGEGL
jgi:hypothetical protein